MKNLLFGAMLLSTTSFSQLTTFQRTFEAPSEEFVGTIIETSERDYLIGGFTMSYGAGLEDGLLMKTNHLGFPLWSMTYGDGLVQHILDVYEYDADNIYFTGYTETASEGEEILFGKIDGDGVVQWIKSYGGDGDDWARTILKDTDDNFYLIGTTLSSFSDGNEDIYIVKTDSDGNMIWDQSYGEADRDEGDDAAWDSNGDIIMSAWTESFSANKDAIVMKLDTAGAVLWANKFDSPKAERAKEMLVNSSDEIYIAGFTKMDLNYASSKSNPYLLKLDAAGDQLWLKVYEDSLQTSGHELQPGADGGYVLTCDRHETVGETDTMDCAFIKVDDDGAIEWSKVVGGDGDERRPRITSTYDDGYMAASYTSSNTGDTMNHVYLIKMDELGESGCFTTDFGFDEVDTVFTQASVTWNTGSGGVENTIAWTAVAANFTADTLCQFINDVGIKETNPFKLAMYPNPATTAITIEVSGVDDPKISVRDMTGKLVIKERQVTSDETTISIENLQSGIYFIEIKGLNQRISKKLIVR